MTSQRAKELLPVITAFAEGKTIQHRVKGDTAWREPKNASLGYAWEDDFEYRIKPEPGEWLMVVATEHNNDHPAGTIDWTATERVNKPGQPAVSYTSWRTITVREVIEP